jgi:hypothetical protein
MPEVTNEYLATFGNNPRGEGAANATGGTRDQKNAILKTGGIHHGVASW